MKKNGDIKIICDKKKNITVRDDDLIRVIKISILTTNQQFAACKIIGNKINILHNHDESHFAKSKNIKTD